MLTRTSRGLLRTDVRAVRAGHTYGPRVPASCVLHVPEAQGSLPRDLTHGTYAARAPASGVPYVPRTVWCTTGARRA